MLDKDDVTDLVKNNEINLFCTDQDTILSDNNTLLKKRVWDNDSIVRFNRAYRNYLTNRRQNLNAARVELNAAFGEFGAIRDEVLFYNKDLVLIVNNISVSLIDAHKHIIDNLERIAFLNDDIKIMMRAKLACDLKNLDTTKHLCDKALIIIDQKSFKEKALIFAKEHPIVCIVGGVVVGLCLGGLIYFVGTAALAKLGALAIKEGAVYLGSNVAATCTVKTAVIASCTVGGIVGGVVGGVLAIKAEDLAKHIHLKKIYHAERNELLRNIATLTEEHARQKDLEKERKNPTQKNANNA